MNAKCAPMAGYPMRHLYNSNECKFAVSNKIPRNDVLRWLVFWYFSCGVEFCCSWPSCFCGFRLPIGGVGMENEISLDGRAYCCLRCVCWGIPRLLPVHGGLSVVLVYPFSWCCCYHTSSMLVKYTLVSNA